MSIVANRSWAHCFSRAWAWSVACMIGAALGLPTQARAARTITVCFWSGGNLAFVQRSVPDDGQTAAAAIQALAAGPSASEQAQGYYSAIPAGTRIQQFVIDPDVVTVDFSRELITADFGDGLLEQVYKQVFWTLRQAGLAREVKLTIDGRLLCDYLPPPPKLTSKPIALAAPPAGVAPLSLTGHSVTLGPSHGNYWDGSSWPVQRVQYCAPLNEEDYHSLEMSQYLQTYLQADGMTVRMCRCTDKNFGSDTTDTAYHIHSGLPWWELASYLWVQHLGYDCTVYAGSTHDCTTGSGNSEYNDDIDARPYMSNVDKTDILVALHTDGVTGHCTGSGCPTGTKTFYDNGTAHRTWGPASQTLATDINSEIMNAISANVDASWTCSMNDGSFNGCVLNSNGNYGEIRLPQRPASLTELAFHDTCDRDADANHLLDNFFRSAAMWGMYKGICDYFGVSPTWDFYSDEYVSDTIPATMQGGQVYSVSITLRNRGVLWSEKQTIRLGAVGGSDPFTTSTRVTIPGEVGPGQTYTFTFNLTAPKSGGTYTTDWQMVRDPSTWFGAICSRAIQVSPAPVAADFDVDNDVDQEDFGHFQACLSPDVGVILPNCANADLNGNGTVDDQLDFAIFLNCFSGAGIALDPNCAN